MSPLRFCRNEDVKMKKLLSLWLLLCTTASASPYQIVIHDEAFSRDSRTLASRIYYPTEAEGPRQNVGANPVFTGIAGQIDAPPAKGTFPLVVFSHGSGGNNTSQAWLAAALVSQGVVVIAANSPGSTTGDSVPAQSINLWRQTEDISALIDAIGASLAGLLSSTLTPSALSATQGRLQRHRGHRRQSQTGRFHRRLSATAAVTQLPVLYPGQG